MLQCLLCSKCYKICPNWHFHCNLSQHKFNAACQQIKVRVTQHVLWHQMTIHHIIFKVSDEWVVLNRISLIGTPLSGNSLASVWIPRKSSHGSLSLLPSETIWPLKLQLPRKLGMNMPENRPCCSPGTAQEKARYSLRNKMLYDPAAVSLFSESSAMEWVRLWAQLNTGNICFKEKQ